MKMRKIMLPLLLALLLCMPALAEADLYAFELELDGVTYSFPTDFAALEAQGWTYLGDKTETLGYNYYSVASRFEKGEARIYATLFNPAWDVKPSGECQVAGLDVELDDLEGLRAVLPGGIEIGVADKAAAEAAYGAPTDTYEGSMYTSYTYELDYGCKVELEFDAETGLLSAIDLRNLVSQDAPDPATVADEPSDEEKAYTAPAELGTELLSFQVNYGDALYVLPAPFSAFVQNGWKLMEDEIVPAQSTARVEMRLQNQTLRTYVYNPSEKAAFAHNCLVTGVEQDVNGVDIDLELPGGVKLGDPGEELEQYAALSPETDDGSSLFTYYTYGEYGQSVTILVNKETGLVSKIEVENCP